MNEESYNGGEQRAGEWMRGLAEARRNLRAGLYGAMGPIRTAAEADAERQRQIDKLEEIWELPPSRT